VHDRAPLVDLLDDARPQPLLDGPLSIVKLGDGATDCEERVGNLFGHECAKRESMRSRSLASRA
jgi:hypothetical protein